MTAPKQAYRNLTLLGKVRAIKYGAPAK